MLGFPRCNARRKSHASDIGFFPVSLLSTADAGAGRRFFRTWSFS